MEDVLIACEFSGIVRDAFIKRGHNAISCDFLPTDRPGPHIQGDALQAIQSRRWKLVIAHPPCTFLCNSGVRWLHTDEGRWEKMEEGARFFADLLYADVPRIAVENPVMHRYAKDFIGENFTQSVQPWQFGIGETKRTCLWLKNLPNLVPTDIVDGRSAVVHRASPGPDRWKLRSVTCQGIADAMAEQWGALL